MKYHSNLKNAKLANNVTCDNYFDIPLENVCLPGLYITLGVYMYMLNELQQCAKELDIEIAVHCQKLKPFNK